MNENEMNNEQQLVWDILKNKSKKESQITLDLFSKTNAGLECPRCSSMDLHHTGVEFFQRNEDAESGDHITVFVQDGSQWFGTNMDASFCDNDMQRNPSVRRGGLIVMFECENCGPGLNLQIAQHKGNTHINWKYIDHEKH